MRTVVQKAVIRVITREIIRFNCDYCGAVCGTRENYKQTVYGQGTVYHYCKKKGCWGASEAAEDARGEASQVPGRVPGPG
jgi:hypothetical protein